MDEVLGQAFVGSGPGLGTRVGLTPVGWSHTIGRGAEQADVVLQCSTYGASRCAAAASALLIPTLQRAT